MNVATGAERKVGTPSSRGRVDAPSWGADGQIVYHVTTGGGRGAAGERSRDVELSDRRQDDHRQRERVRVPRLVGVADDVLLRVGRQDPQARRHRRRGAETIEFTRDAAGHARRDNYTRRKRDFTSTAPRQVLGVVHPVLSPDGKQIAFAAVGDIYVMPVGGKPVNITKTRRSTPIRRGRRTARSSPTRRTRTASTCSSGSAT